MPAVRLVDGCVVPDLPPSQQDQSLHQTCGGHSAGLLLGSLLFWLVSHSSPHIDTLFLPTIVNSFLPSFNKSQIYLFYRGINIIEIRKITFGECRTLPQVPSMGVGILTYTHNIVCNTHTHSNTIAIQG